MAAPHQTRPVALDFIGRVMDRLANCCDQPISRSSLRRATSWMAAFLTRPISGWSAGSDAACVHLSIGHVRWNHAARLGPAVARPSRSPASRDGSPPRRRRGTPREHFNLTQDEPRRRRFSHERSVRLPQLRKNGSWPRRVDRHRQMARRSGLSLSKSRSGKLGTDSNGLNTAWRWSRAIGRHLL
jgi:hypothetical protein